MTAFLKVRILMITWYSSVFEVVEIESSYSTSSEALHRQFHALSEHFFTLSLVVVITQDILLITANNHYNDTIIIRALHNIRLMVIAILLELVLI